MYVWMDVCMYVCIYLYIVTVMFIVIVLVIYTYGIKPVNSRYRAIHRRYVSDDLAAIGRTSSHRRASRKGRFSMLRYAQSALARSSHARMHAQVVFPFKVEVLESRGGDLVQFVKDLSRVPPSLA
jgi:hypothetical protein